MSAETKAHLTLSDQIRPEAPSLLHQHVINITFINTSTNTMPPTLLQPRTVDERNTTTPTNGPATNTLKTKNQINTPTPHQHETYFWQTNTPTDHIATFTLQPLNTLSPWAARPCSTCTVPGGTSPQRLPRGSSGGHLPGRNSHPGKLPAGSLS